MMNVTSETGELKRQGRLIAIILVPMIGLLALGYFWFLRGDYAVLANDLRPEEAAAIVEELKKEDVALKLQNSGSTILVPASELDAIRLGLTGKELPIKGTVGFELFNESDMGLTDFAQKVNYQRALQGEIARTIMAMDGIAAARVHLALPERSLFRAHRSEPKAAVTVTPSPNVTVDADRITGVQRLVAAAVPDLKVDQVAVLNERGQLLTPAYDDSVGDGSVTALERSYVERAGTVISQRFPNLAFDLKITTIPRNPAGSETIKGAAPAADTVRDHSIRLVVFTRSPISVAQEEELKRAISSELSLDPGEGDALQFSRSPEMARPPLPQANAAPTEPKVEPIANIADQIFDHWLIAMTGIGVFALALLAWRTRRLQAQRHETLAVRIREQLKLTHVGLDAAG